MESNGKNTMNPSKIIGIQFSILSPDEIRKQSVAEITSRDTYINNKPVLGGLFDPRMGVLEPGLLCPTDGLNYIDTPGYFGHINLARPVFYIQYITSIIFLIFSVTLLRILNYYNVTIIFKILISSHNLPHKEIRWIVVLVS